MLKRRHIEFARKTGWRVVRRVGLRVLLRPNGWRFLFGTLTPRHMGRAAWNEPADDAVSEMLAHASAEGRLP